ncbi:acyltransferase family protein [Serratia oryzae]|nr:acyltransferase [Serratia oryzae]
MKLSEIIKKGNNNLDIFRLIAALMVIYGHAYAISPQEGKEDVLLHIIGFDYSGSLAVKIFFFLSGLVVTNSLMANQNVVKFFISRLFRIWPALIVTVVFSSLVLGPLLTELSFLDYLSSREVYSYIYKNIFMDIQYSLPGVFVDNKRDAVNGSLWTIPYEVSAYLILVAAFMLGVLKRKIFASILFLIIVAEPLFGNKILFTWISADNREISMLAPCFAFGAILAIWKDEIFIDRYSFLGVWILFYFFRTSEFSFYFFYFSIFISMLYISTTPFFIRLKPPFDISYGVYLWAWPIQQVIARSFDYKGVLFNQLSSSILAIIMGLISWYVIEKKCIKAGVNFSVWLSDRWSNLRSNVAVKSDS